MLRAAVQPRAEPPANAETTLSLHARSRSARLVALDDRLDVAFTARRSASTASATAGPTRGDAMTVRTAGSPRSVTRALLALFALLLVHGSAIGAQPAPSSPNLA